MMDVREKLVELQSIITCPNAICNFCEHFKNKSACERHKKEVIADNMIAHGVTVQDWISVDDRLPEYSNDGFADAVLVTDGFVQHMAYFVGGEWRFAESGEIKEPMWYRITHWMPLPLPPKGE